VAAAEAFRAGVPEGFRPEDILPGARSVVVAGGDGPTAGAWRCPDHRVMDITGYDLRENVAIHAMCDYIERELGYYAVQAPSLPARVPGVPVGNAEGRAHRDIDLRPREVPLARADVRHRLVPESAARGRERGRRRATPRDDPLRLLREVRAVGRVLPRLDRAVLRVHARLPRRPQAQEAEVSATPGTRSARSRAASLAGHPRLEPATRHPLQQ